MLTRSLVAQKDTRKQTQYDPSAVSYHAVAENGAWIVERSTLRRRLHTGTGEMLLTPVRTGPLAAAAALPTRLSVRTLASQGAVVPVCIAMTATALNTPAARADWKAVALGTLEVPLLLLPLSALTSAAPRLPLGLSLASDAVVLAVDAPDAAALGAAHGAEVLSWDGQSPFTAAAHYGNAISFSAAMARAGSAAARSETARGHELNRMLTDTHRVVKASRLDKAALWSRMRDVVSLAVAVLELHRALGLPPSRAAAAAGRPGPTAKLVLLPLTSGNQSTAWLVCVALALLSPTFFSAGVESKLGRPPAHTLNDAISVANGAFFRLWQDGALGSAPHHHHHITEFADNIAAVALQFHCRSMVDRAHSDWKLLPGGSASIDGACFCCLSPAYLLENQGLWAPAGQQQHAAPDRDVIDLTGDSDGEDNAEMAVPALPLFAKPEPPTEEQQFTAAAASSTSIFGDCEQQSSWEAAALEASNNWFLTAGAGVTPFTPSTLFNASFHPSSSTSAPMEDITLPPPALVLAPQPQQQQQQQAPPPPLFQQVQQVQQQAPPPPLLQPQQRASPPPPQQQQQRQQLMPPAAAVASPLEQLLLYARSNLEQCKAYQTLVTPQMMDGVRFARGVRHMMQEMEIEV